MSDFPRSSSFKQALETNSVRDIFERTEVNVAKEEAKAASTTKVAFSDLERWYNALNDLELDDYEELDSMRDEIYSHLKGQLISARLDG